MKTSGDGYISIENITFMKKAVAMLEKRLLKESMAVCRSTEENGGDAEDGQERRYEKAAKVRHKDGF